MKLRPLHDRIVVRPLEAEEKTAGGIVIPDTAKEKPIRGEVVAVGAGMGTETGKLVPLEVKAGDLVLFGKYAGTEIEFEGEHLLVMREADLFAVGGTHGRDDGDDE